MLQIANPAFLSNTVQSQILTQRYSKAYDRRDPSLFAGPPVAIKFFVSFLVYKILIGIHLDSRQLLIMFGLILK